MWIETFYDATSNVTAWRVISGERIVHEGELEDDASGLRAYEAASAWIASQERPVSCWKHAVYAPDPGIARQRVTTSRSAPLRLHGWAMCRSGGREPVAVSPQEMRALEERELTCPVCGDACGATLTPDQTVAAVALSWTGKRWHST